MVGDVRMFSCYALPTRDRHVLALYSDAAQYSIDDSALDSAMATLVDEVAAELGRLGER